MISDSLALPRGKPEKVKFEDTYFAKLQNEYSNLTFMPMFIGGATLSFLCDQVSYLIEFNPDLVFIQSGVVDCAPRAFKQLELQIIRKIGLRIPKTVIKKLREYRKVKYTPPNYFHNRIKDIIQLFGKEKVYWISIMPACEEWENLVPGITKSVELYNSILNQELQQHLLCSEANLDWLMSDFHHLNTLGHQCVYSAINSIIEKKLEI